jgi:two-component system, OmpR family, response regulator
MRWEPRLELTGIDGMNHDIGGTGYVLIVNHDRAIREVLGSNFSEHEFPASCCSDWSKLKCNGRPPSLIIMDQPLGLHEALDRLRSIRSKTDVPIIITGNRVDEVDSILSLELGADDYIVKPSPRELLARARAILRRRQAPQTRKREGGGYRFNGWHLDRYGRNLVDPKGASVSLTKGEQALLLAFLGAPERPLTREQLVKTTRLHEDVFDRSVDVQVLRLRRKLESGPDAPRGIRTERGIGYVFALPVERF